MNAELLLSSLQTYGVWSLALALFLGAAGLPLPCSLLLLASGALVRAGTLDAVPVLVVAVVMTVLGDCLSYSLAHVGRAELARRAVSMPRMQAARRAFARWGGIAIVLTRFALTPLAIPTNLLAGSSRYSFRRFLLFDALGELIWVSGYLGLGYLFAHNWARVELLSGSVTTALLSAALAGGAVYILSSGLRLRERTVAVLGS